MLSFFAQTTYDYTVNSETSSGAGMVILVIYLAVLAFLLVSMAKVYQKAKRQWWEAIVPIYNMYIMLKIVGRPDWWLVLYFIPLVNFVISIIVALDLAKSFGKGTGTGILLIFFPFIMYPIMAFSKDYQYSGPSVSQ